jgi:hypothetical protein
MLARALKDGIDDEPGTTVERRFGEMVSARGAALTAHLEDVGGPDSGGGMTFKELLLTAGPLKPGAKKKAAKAKAKFEQKRLEAGKRSHRWGTGISSESSSPLPPPKAKPKPKPRAKMSAAAKASAQAQPLQQEGGGGGSVTDVDDGEATVTGKTGRRNLPLQEFADREFGSLRSATKSCPLFGCQFLTGPHRAITRAIKNGQKELEKAACGAALLLRLQGRGLGRVVGWAGLCCAVLCCVELGWAVLCCAVVIFVSLASRIIVLHRSNLA